MKHNTYYLIFFLFLSNTVHGAERSDTSLYKLHFLAGAEKIIQRGPELRPFIGITLISPHRSFYTTYLYSFSLFQREIINHARPQILENTYKHHLELNYQWKKSNNDELLTFSTGLCRMHIGPFPENTAYRHYHKNLVTGSVSLPIGGLRLELRFNLLPEEIKRELSAGYSHFSFSVYYRFRPFS
jgi:hypothetical protein